MKEGICSEIACVVNSRLHSKPVIRVKWEPNFPRVHTALNKRQSFQSCTIAFTCQTTLLHGILYHLTFSSHILQGKGICKATPGTSETFRRAWGSLPQCHCYTPCFLCSNRASPPALPALLLLLWAQLPSPDSAQKWMHRGETDALTGMDGNLPLPSTAHLHCTKLNLCLKKSWQYLRLEILSIE